MLANFLEKSKPINFIVYLGLFLTFFLITIFSNFFSDEFSGLKLLESGSFFLLFLTIFFFYNFVVSKNKLTFDHSYAFLLFVLATILFLPKLLEFKVLLTLLIYLLFLRKVYSLRSSKNVIQKIFDSGFWLGILFILEPFSILFFIVVYASVLLHQKIIISTLVTPIIGFIAPLVIYFAYLFWNDSIDEFIQLFYLDELNSIHIYAKDATIWVFGTILLLTIFSFFLKSPKVISVNNSFKKSWYLLIINAIVAVFFALLIQNKDGSELIFLLVPTTIIIANGFEIIEKTIVKNILFGLLLVVTFATYFII